MMEPVLTIVVPCYNEEEVLPDTIHQLEQFVKQLIRSRLFQTELESYLWMMEVRIEHGRSFIKQD